MIYYYCPLMLLFYCVLISRGDGLSTMGGTNTRQHFYFPDRHFSTCAHSVIWNLLERFVSACVCVCVGEEGDGEAEIRRGFINREWEVLKSATLSFSEETFLEVSSGALAYLRGGVGASQESQRSATARSLS